MRVAICGIAGQMGRAVLKQVLDKNYTLQACFDTNQNFVGQKVGELIGDNTLTTTITTLEKADLSQVDGIIDFSLPGATNQLLVLAKKFNKPVVIGTTGFTSSEEKMIAETAKKIPILFSANMSLGVNLLFKLTKIATELLDESYDLEILEAHHRRKKDSPSGTAKKLIQILKQNRPALTKDSEKNGRFGNDLTRTSEEIGVMALRGGDVVGEHTVFFLGQGERIELTHRASDRTVFAKGALPGLEFLLKQKPGLYSMADVLGFN